MGQPRVTDQTFHRGKNLRHAGLVIRPQQSGPVGDHQLLAHLLQQVGKRRRRQGNPLLLIQDQHASLIGDNPGLHRSPGDPGRRVHVGDEGNHRNVLPSGGGREPPIDRAVVRQAGPFQAHLRQLPGQNPAQRPLFLRGRGRLRPLLGLGIKGNILQKPLQCCHLFSHASSHALARSRAFCQRAYSRLRSVLGA